MAGASYDECTCEHHPKHPTRPANRFGGIGPRIEMNVSRTGPSPSPHAALCVMVGLILLFGRRRTADKYASIKTVRAVKGYVPNGNDWTVPFALNLLPHGSTRSYYIRPDAPSVIHSLVSRTTRCTLTAALLLHRLIPIAVGKFIHRTHILRCMCWQSCTDASVLNTIKRPDGC